MASFRFSKYSGCGNDFILIDNRSPKDFSALQLKQLCHRHEGIGADGVILLEHSSVCDYKMRIFNADGTEAEMCGNGMRCLGLFIHECGDTRPTLSIETMERTLSPNIEGKNVGVEMGRPTHIRWNETVTVGNRQLLVHFLNTGVPHAVHFIDPQQAAAFPVLEVARPLRSHDHYGKQGANVNIATVHGNHIELQTYERGVEGITQACGTGATATALAAAKMYGLSSPIHVRVPSGDTLQISFQESNGLFEDIRLSGPAKKVFTGKSGIIC